MGDQEDAIAKGLLRELIHDEDVLSEAARGLQEARTQFEVASQKYAAVRDVVGKHLGRNPRKESVMDDGVFRHLSGRFRFIHMSPRDAVVAALTEAKEALTLEEIVEVLRTGAFRGALPRVINATLMRTSGVEKTEDGKYRYIQPEADELPFE